ncbi:50S ribosomal protein L5, partial [Myxococcota bacterium]|nr:50S ribosomal protein L5 [Myxococcota bacterium]
MAPRLQEKFRSDIAPNLKSEFGYGNPHEVPTLTKVVVNMGLGEATQNSKIIDRASEELGLITGQKPVIRKATKSVSNFRLREGQA